MTHTRLKPQKASEMLYEQDYYLWLHQTAAHLRARLFDPLDLVNLIAEIEDMGRREKRAIESNVRIILLHLLKWKYQPENRSGSWSSSITEHRIRIRKALQDSPSLKSFTLEIVAEAYHDARKLASLETGLGIDLFPLTCEWTAETLFDEDWFPAP